VIERHFTLEPGIVVLRSWLDDVAAQVFAAYGDRWVRGLTGRLTNAAFPRKPLAELVTAAAKEHDISEWQDDLSQGIWAFLTSEEREDQDLVMSYGQAMFASRLMAADLSIDPISAERLQGGTLLLDTNVMIRFALGGAVGESALGSLAQAFERLGVDVQYLPRTLGEYQRVCNAQREQILRVVDKTQNHFVLQQTQDEWIEAGLKSESYRTGGWNGFFDELADPSNEFDAGVPATLVEDDSILGAADDGADDENRIENVQNAWLGAREGREPKKDRVAQHDAALDAASIHIHRSGRPCVVASTDRSMLDYASGLAGGSGSPRWISIEALFQIFAAEQEVNGESATDFAPLLSKLISDDLHQASDLNYTVDDLDYLAGLEADVAELPPHDIQTIARKLHHLRMNGAARDDLELRRTIRNLVAKRKREIGHELEGIRATAAANHTRAEGLAEQLAAAKRAKADAEAREKSRVAKAEADAKAEAKARDADLVREKAKPIRAVSRAASVILGLLGIVGVVFIGWTAFQIASPVFDNDSVVPREDQIQTGADMLGIGAMCLSVLFWPAIVLWKRADRAEEIASSQLRAEGRIE